MQDIPSIQIATTTKTRTTDDRKPLKHNSGSRYNLLFLGGLLFTIGILHVQYATPWTMARLMACVAGTLTRSCASMRNGHAEIVMAK